MVKDEAFDNYMKDVARFYDLEYDEVSEDIPFFIEYAKKKGSPILELGCGTGRVLIPIARSGLEIWGLDASEEMLNVARSKIEALDAEIASRITLRKGDMKNFFLPKKFNLIIIPFRSFLALSTKEEQETSLRCIRKHLTNKGLLIIDIFAPRYDILAKGHLEIIKEKLDEKSGIKLIINASSDYDHKDQLIHVHKLYKIMHSNGTVEEIRQDFTLRYTFRYEMEYLLEKEGFAVIDVFGSFNKKPYDYTSGEMIFVAKPSTRGIR